MDTPINRRSVLRLTACGLALLLCIRATAGDEEATLEDQVKAACLYRFAVHTEWPEDAFRVAESPFVIGLVGEVSFGAMVETGLRGKTLDGRAIVVQSVRTIEEAGNCHLIFFGRMEEPEDLRALLEAIAERPTLTVGEGPKFIESGGIMNFVKAKGYLRFEVNREAAERAGLKLGSQMLKLALIVQLMPERQEKVI